MIVTLLSIILFLWVFWGLYVLVMGVYRAHLNKELSKVGYAFGLPWVIIGYAVDIFAQFTIANILFLDLPRKGEWLVTTRLQRYLQDGKGWRYYKADWVCKHLLDIF